MARVILLNGPGSVGKTSVARALQAGAGAPILHFSMDGWCGMLPDRTWDDRDFFRFESRPGAEGPATDVQVGPKGAALLAAMRAAVAELAGRGFDVIVDDVWLDGEPGDYATLLAGHQIWRVGLTAPLDVIEARERARGDRAVGLARTQIDRVHRGVQYDLQLDVSVISPEAAASRIAALAGLSFGA